MSVFSGRQHKRAMREHRTRKYEAAFERQFSIWNNGTGMYLRRPNDAGLHRVMHPINMVPRKDWHLYAKQFPELNLG